MGSSIRESPQVNFRQIAAGAITNGAQQKPRELAQFLELVSALNPRVIVEIGVHAGGTLFAWRQLAETVVGIDEFPGGAEPIYCISGHPRNEHGAETIIGDSHNESTVSALTDLLDGRLIDCLFIDGDHTYDGVRQDYEMYRPLVRAGGLIGFHDIATHDLQNCDVEQFWNEIKDQSSVEIIDPEGGPWGGIGAIGR